LPVADTRNARLSKSFSAQEMADPRRSAGNILGRRTITLRIRPGQNISKLVEHLGPQSRAGLHIARPRALHSHSLQRARTEAQDGNALGGSEEVHRGDTVTRQLATIRFGDLNGFPRMCFRWRHPNGPRPALYGARSRRPFPGVAIAPGRGRVPGREAPTLRSVALLAAGSLFGIRDRNGRKKSVLLLTTMPGLMLRFGGRNHESR
jgi:hypothetical protein